MKKAIQLVVVIAMVTSFIFGSIYAPRQVLAASQQEGEIRNIIILIPDGLSVSGTTLARWLRSYDPATGTVDPTVRLAKDELLSGMVRTFWVDHLGTVGGMIDSAPAATAFAAGIHTENAHLSVTSGDLTPVATVLEAANAIGKSTGLVATSNVQHATPAAFSSHTYRRALFEIIGEQQAYNHIDVMFGGGYQFLQAENREDGEDILGSLQERGYQLIHTRDEMLAATEKPIWGLFAPDAMAYDWDKVETGEPSLAEMTEVAIDLLSQNEEGFFLMVEGSKIDWAGHRNNPAAYVSDILAFDDAVRVALDFAQESQDTMLLIVSDHTTGGLSIGNRFTDSTYMTDPINMHVSLLSRTTLTAEGIFYRAEETGEDIIGLVNTHAAITDLTPEEIADLRNAETNRDFQEILGLAISNRSGLAWTTHGHTGDDVPLYTYLPGNGRIVGLFDNTDIAHFISDAWGLDLPQLTSEIFVNANEAFEGYITELYYETHANARMIVEMDGNTLEILENKNYVILNGEVVEFGSVAVFSGGNFFIPNVIIMRLLGSDSNEVSPPEEGSDPNDVSPPEEGSDPGEETPPEGSDPGDATPPEGSDPGEVAPPEGSDPGDATPPEGSDPGDATPPEGSDPGEAPGAPGGSEPDKIPVTPEVTRPGNVSSAPGSNAQSNAPSQNLPQTGIQTSITALLLGGIFLATGLKLKNKSK